jgi:hypothetical protein
LNVTAPQTRRQLAKPVLHVMLLQKTQPLKSAQSLRARVLLKPKSGLAMKQRRSRALHAPSHPKTLQSPRTAPKHRVLPRVAQMFGIHPENHSVRVAKSHQVLAARVIDTKMIAQLAHHALVKKILTPVRHHVAAMTHR